MAVAHLNIMGHHKLITCEVHDRAHLRDLLEIVVIFQRTGATALIHILGKDDTTVRCKVDVIPADDPVSFRVACAPEKL